MAQQTPTVERLLEVIAAGTVNERVNEYIGLPNPHPLGLEQPSAEFIAILNELLLIAANRYDEFGASPRVTIDHLIIVLTAELFGFIRANTGVLPAEDQPQILWESFAMLVNVFKEVMALYATEDTTTTH